MKKRIIVPTCLLLSVYFISCASSAVPEDKNLSAAEYFQKAYEATDNKNYKLALRYYELFQQKFPEDIERNLWAEYEIAFTYYKMGNTQKAIELFDKLIARYDGEEAAGWPPAPKALAEKVKATLEK